jgi:hypothetical protein
MMLRYVVMCGGLAGLASMSWLSLASRLEGREIWRPANATSHWLHGDDEASESTALDLPHTAVGAATHQASAMFWALPFGAWLAGRPKRTVPAMLRDASVMAAIAAITDYVLVPKRVTPGWELVLPKRAVAGGFVALALGLAAGGLVAQSRR